ncbi:Hint domain-containing protein [Jannaschia ovalis]|uniref:Hint domain-containing protein n=1 Tax=Jannaschia ovalis TaxID=3038773 RepID=A0ABY8LEU8_9RHOB|nr:Hint domain-containing protein [Jannaschia sp. GRR-S6-38]WGH79172.1 Hint domain-containing protein [Jannaschia sp. GRR-S6-38]
MADKLNGIIISEVLADNPSSGGFDTDGDGRASKSDEFIEIQNTTGNPISLAGYQLWSDDRGLLYEFGPGTTIAPGGTATVVGEYTGTPPPGFYDAGLSNSGNFLPDGEGSKFDTIYLVDPATGDFIALSYGDPPRPPDPPQGFPGTNQQGSGEQINSNAPNGTAFSRNAEGQFVEDPNPDPGTPGVACYAAGTLIATPDGPRRIETLAAGDHVGTLDGGAAPIRLMLFRREQFEDPDAARPIQIKAGALGPGRPARDLVVSANHRILVGGQGQLADRFPAECFVPAKALVGLPRIRVMAGKRAILWVHFLLPDHGVVFAEGACSESILPGPVALRQAAPGPRRVLRAGAPAAPRPARPCLTPRQAAECLAPRPAAAPDAVPA